MPARPDILAALTEAGIERIVVHTRDPRQSMISGIHHHAGMFANGSFEATVFVTRLPRDYTQWDFAEQADHYLAHRFEQEVRWVADWRKTVREGQFPGRVLLTNYETFRQDNQAISRPFWPSTISRSKCLIGAKSRPHPKKARYTTAAARP